MFNELPPYLASFQPGARFRFAMLRITRYKSAHMLRALKGAVSRGLTCPFLDQRELKHIFAHCQIILSTFFNIRCPE
jgi:hypothetical protein